MYKIYTIIY